MIGPRSFVVTGGAGGIGRAIVERLLEVPGHRVVAIDLSTTGPPPDSESRLIVLEGDASDPDVTGSAADLASRGGPLAGWVNSAAVFMDVYLHATPNQVMESISLNLDHAVAGSATAVRRFLAQGGGGAIVNISSHQATRPVPGALAYATAKAGIEGLTRATAVERTSWSTG